MDNKYEDRQYDWVEDAKAKLDVYNEDGSLNEEKVWNELGDFRMVIEFYGEVLSYITNDRMSRLSYFPSSIISVVDDLRNEEITDYVKDFVSDLEGVLSAYASDDRTDNLWLDLRSTVDHYK